MADATTKIKEFLFYLTIAGIKVFSLPLCKNIIGAENLPTEPFLIASNHRSLLDGVIVVNEFNRIRGKAIHMIAYEEPAKNPFFGRIMKISGCITFDRSDPESRIGVLQTALGFLKEGEPVAIFPEAHLSPDGKMGKARPGMALLAIESGVPIVPVGIRNSEKVLEPGTGKFRLGTRAIINIGKPVFFEDQKEAFSNADKKGRLRIIKNISDAVMLKIAELSGQEYLFAKNKPDRK